MRGRLWPAVLVLGLCAARPAWGQGANTWGPPVGPIQNQVVNTGGFPTLVNGPTWSERFRSLRSLLPSFGSANKKPQARLGQRKPNRMQTAAGRH